MSAPDRQPAVDAAATDTDAAPFPIHDGVGAWVPHGRFVVHGAKQGPLAGLRFAAKDVFHVAGRPTGAGNPQWLDTHPLPDATNPLIDALLAAGATLVGKTLTDELAYSIHGDNLHYGTPVNMAAPGRVPGGSSSGSAAAVAAALCDFALGTDTGGSTRVPASYCGLWGLRTTHGLLSREAMVPLSPGFDTPTWLARDAEIFSRVGALLLPGSPAAKFARVLMLNDLMAEADALFAAPAQQVFDALADGRMTQHVRVTGHDLPDTLEAWRQVYVTASAYEAWQTHGAWITQYQPRFSDAIAGRWAAARNVSGDSAREAVAMQARMRAAVQALLGNDGVAVLPSAASVAPLLTASGEAVDRIRMRTFRITCVAGLAGLPQVSIPFATPDGLPIGISLMGPAGSDKALIALAIEVAQTLGRIPRMA